MQLDLLLYAAADLERITCAKFERWLAEQRLFPENVLMLCMAIQSKGSHW